MAQSSKSDADTPSASRADSGAGDSKKPRTSRLTRARTIKVVADKAEKVAKPAKPRGKKAPGPKAEQTEFAGVTESRPAPESRPPEPPPAPEFRAPEPVREFTPEPRPEPAPRTEPEARETFVPRSFDTGPAEQSGGDAGGSARESESRGGSDQGAATGNQDSSGGGHQSQAPQPHSGQQNRGEWQGHQGGQQGNQGGDRGFWKHGKRKRGRHGGGGGGGHWQQGGGGGHGGGGHGGGHGGREQHPPQLPPPSNTPVFGDLPNPSRFNDLAALDALADQLSAGEGEVLQLNRIYALTLAELTAFARTQGVKFDGAPARRQLLPEIFKFAAATKRPVRDTGYIDQNDRGCFVVHEHVNYRLYPEDAYLPDSLVKRYGLKRGHRVEVVIQPPLEGERCPSVVRVDRVMGMPADEIAKVTPFEELVPYYPLKRILLEDADVVKDVSMRSVDILTPIGFGQRGLIVAPPRTGKTVLLQNIANSISANSPDVKLILLLIDERPEEVTDFKRHTKGEVVSSTFDETPESHVHCAEMVIEICRRRVEQGEHVVILLDSITRLARAYNALTGNGGKTMSGGLESNALQKPKRFFGSARNIEGGGSLTIIASALIDTGSRMDEIIFEEFKGTGNSELHLDRGLVERRIFPAINIDRSGTRREELLYHPDELQRIFALRRAMQGLGPIESMEMLITRLKKTKSNAEFLLSLAPK
jgi:transcription termination factor Rho